MDGRTKQGIPRIDASRTQMNRAALFYGALSLVIVPAYTVLFASADSLIDSNISIIGSTPGRERSFIVWGLLSAGFFLMMTNYLFVIGRYESGAMRALLHTACGLLVVTTLIPFKPDQKPVSAEIHNVTAMSASVLTLIVVLAYLRHIVRMDPGLKRLLVAWGVLTAVCIGLIIGFGVITGLLEVMFIVAMCQLMFRTMLAVQRSEKIDAAGALLEAGGRGRARLAGE